MLPRGWPARATAPHVKICGVTRPALARAVVAAGADMVGVIHFPPSPRHLPLEAARAVAEAAAADGALVVALTVDADDATLDALVEEVRPAALQLHGSETPAHTAALAARYGILVAKAVGVSRACDLARIAEYADALPVLDAKPPAGADRPGGHGATFDWDILDGLGSASAYMLSGGLGPDNVAEAVRRARPYAVDVSSKVESGGVKDPAKVAAFIAAAKGS